MSGRTPQTLCAARSKDTRSFKMAVGQRSFVVLITALLGAHVQAQLKPGCKIETLRACGDDYVPYGKGAHLHDFGQVFADGCAKDKKQIPCTLKFIRECVIGLPQAAALVAVKALEESIEATCVIGSDAHKKYEKAIGCMNSVGDKLHKCVNGYQTALERAVLKTPPKEVIHYACCHYHDMLGCLATALAPCEKVGAKEIMIGVVEQVFGETLNLVCGRYTKGSEGCRTLPKLPQLSRNDKKIPNFVELMLQVSSTIGRKN